MAFETERESKRRFNEAEGEIRRRRRDVLQQRTRDALPFGGLERGGRSIDPHLEASSRLHGHEAALEIRVHGLHPTHERAGRGTGDGRLPRRLQQIFSNDAAVQLHLPRLHVVRHGADDRQEIRHLFAAETHALGIRRHAHAERLQAGVLDLVLEIRGDLHLRLAHRDVLEARHLHPRVHLLDVERERPLRLQQPEHQHALLPDAGLLRIELRDAVARRDLQSHALLGNNRQLPALLARLAEHKPRHRGRFRRLRSRPGQIHVELLLPLGLAFQVHRDDSALGCLQFGPMTERRAADALHVQSRRQHKADAENPRARHSH